MARWHPGLRFQIMLTLALILVGGMVLFQFATIRLARISLDRQRAAGQAAVLAGEGDPDDVLSVTQEITKLNRLTLLYMGTSVVIALFFGYVLLTRLIVKPASDLSRATRRVAEGQVGVEVDLIGPSELVDLEMDFNQMSRKLKTQHDDLKARLEQLEKTTAELKAAQDRLIRSAKLASVGRLAAGVAHEIGNPLAAVKGFLDLLGRVDPRSAEAVQYRSLAQEEVERIHRVIAELLAYARPQAEGGTGVRLEAAVDRAYSLCKVQRLFDGVVLDTRIPPECPPILASMDQMSQILVNLFLNAAAAMQGRGKVTVQADVLDAWQPDPTSAPRTAVCLAVTDTGPGIPAEHLDKVFEPFFSTKPTGEGSGLGLAVTQAIVDRQGGDIRASNAQGAGASITVVLPASMETDA